MIKIPKDPLDVYFLLFMLLPWLLGFPNESLSRFDNLLTGFHQKQRESRMTSIEKHKWKNCLIWCKFITFFAIDLYKYLFCSTFHQLLVLALQLCARH